MHSNGACANPDLLGGGGGCIWMYEVYIHVWPGWLLCIYIILGYTLVYCISYCLIEGPISQNYIIGASLNSLPSKCIYNVTKLYKSGQLVTMAIVTIVMQYIVCT